MKSLSPTVTSMLNAEVSTLAHCWKITRRDGGVVGFTDHNQSLTVEGILYHAQSGFTPSAIASNALLKADNLSVEGLLDSDHISEAAIVAGEYDNALMDVFQVDYTQPDAGVLHLKTGWIGSIQLQSGKFVAQLRGLTQILNNHVGTLYAPRCRAQLGDAQCGVDMSSRNVTSSVTHVTSRTVFTDSSRSEPENTFHFGTLTWLTGDNQGQVSEIRRYSEGGTFTLLLPLAHDIQIGDSFRAAHGCDRYFSTCCERFNNAVNFRGEPHVSGMDALYTTASTT